MIRNRLLVEENNEEVEELLPVSINLIEEKLKDYLKNIWVKNFTKDYTFGYDTVSLYLY